ncbi:cuticle protein 19-like [Fopius arisanus]|uniref:Cuticle protein 19-like n=1 Tax=Fopius arisanus TaxID=64838 RepID=A0A9R1TZ01_9HYME|nr:PREDICTED: cuticle protein 19-like [Fopius arisanus]
MRRIIMVALGIVCVVDAKADSYAHSFQHFNGPVTGDDTEVTWTDRHGYQHQDYTADPHYEFAYGVEDPSTGDLHGRKEHHDGKAVTGEYTVKEPDGNIRRVRYRADEDGFHAQVLNSKDRSDEDE